MIKFNPQEEVTSKLKFKPNPTIGNLCIGVLTGVSVEFSEIEELDNKGNKKDWEFAGLKIPRLMFQFKNYTSNHDVDKADRYFTHFESVITTTKNTGEKVDKKIVADLYTAMWKRIKHIHDAFRDTANYSPITEVPDLNDEGTPQERAAELAKFFKFITDAFNGKDNKKKIYEDARGNPIVTFMKLIVVGKNKYLSFPNYVGEGFIERYKEGVPPTLELKPSETIIIKSEEAENKARTQDAVSELPDFIKNKLGA